MDKTYRKISPSLTWRSKEKDGDGEDVGIQAILVVQVRGEGLLDLDGSSGDDGRRQK